MSASQTSGAVTAAAVTAGETAATMRVSLIPQTFDSLDDSRRTLPLLTSSLQQMPIASTAGATISALPRAELSASVRLKAESRQRRFLQALIP
jgi:hypothetical protein